MLLINKYTKLSSHKIPINDHSSNSYARRFGAALHGALVNTSGVIPTHIKIYKANILKQKSYVRFTLISFNSKYMHTFHSDIHITSFDQLANKIHWVII